MAKRGGSHWLANPFFESSGPIKNSFTEYPWKWDSLCCQGYLSAVQPWGLICGQLWILGDSGTGAAVAVVVEVVVVAEVVCRYQKGQLERHEHLYNKAIIWGLNISHSEKIPLLFLFLPMTLPTKGLQTAKSKKCNILHTFYHLWKGLCRSSSGGISKCKENISKYIDIQSNDQYCNGSRLIKTMCKSQMSD